MVIGSTGFSPEQLMEASKLTSSVPSVISPNMSIGVNILFKMVADAARLLGDTCDVEIIEAHHRFKKDAPSGTAVKLAQLVAQSLGRDLGEVGVYARHGLIGERTGSRDRHSDNPRRRHRWRAHGHFRRTGREDRTDSPRTEPRQFRTWSNPRSQVGCQSTRGALRHG